MSIEDVILAYQDRLGQIQSTLASLQLRQLQTAVLLSAAIAVFLALAFGAASRRVFLLLPVPVAALCIRNYGRRQSALGTLNRLAAFYTRAAARVQGNWAGEGDSGEEYAAPGHVYAADLTLFGTGSLFERLSVLRTGVGKTKLASFIQEQTQSVDESLARQAAVQELRGRTDLREAIATLGSEFHESSAATFTEWLDRKPTRFAPWIRALALLTSLITLACVAPIAVTSVPWSTVATFLIPAAAVQAIFGLVLRSRVLPICENSRALSLELGLIRSGLALLAQQDFQSPKLRSLVQRITSDHACGKLRQLQRDLTILSERTKELYYGPSLLVMAGSQAAMGTEAWRIRHRAEFATWLDAWGEFEALIALACYAYESPEDTFPVFERQSAIFEAEGLGHPLLPPGSCVRNDISLSAERHRLLVISGSNMSGKSTLLRSIGLATVLAGAGAPVRARSLRLSPFTTCASLSIQDALQEGKSKFKAEVDRLRETIQLAANRPPVLFLIDEIFSGTNSRDRRIAAEAVVRTLLKSGALGAVSTHDLALTEIAELPEMQGANVHMGSRNGSDPLDFDYLLKPGVTTEANALAIARLAGVPV